MKKICIALLASLACLFVVSCERQEEGNASVGSSKRFRIEAPQFLDENGQKVHLQFSESASNLIYDEGDIVYINGFPFTMTKSEGVWYATSDTAITAERFLVTYVDGVVGTYDSSSSTYQFNLNDNLDKPAHNKAILGGVAENNGDYVISLQPACAILRIDTKGAGANYDYIKVGFEGEKIPAAGTINVSNRTLSTEPSGNYMNGVAQGGGGVINGDFLYMSRRHAGESDYWYVAIPIEGSSVTTTLYLEWTYNGGAQVQRKTQGQVTMQKGYVYTLGTERVSPFNANACGTYFFYVDESNHRVSFTSGNLQCQRYLDESFDEHVRWRFAPSQLNSIGGVNSNNITDDGGELWFDLFGYGTSNWSGSGATAYAPYSTSTNNADYYATDLAGTNADWGVYNRTTPGIYYGSSVVTYNKLRTLTSDEWNFLVGRSGKSGIVCVDGTYNGLMLLPNTGKNGSGTWSNTTDVDLSGLSNTSVTNLSLAQWDTLEAIGAIFLPYGGTRSNLTTSMANSIGVYWSATTNNASRGKAMTANLSSVALTNTTKPTGCSVRLVANVGSW